MRTLAIVALAFILGSGVWGEALAQEPSNITVNVVRQNAEAVIIVNGIPVHRAAWDAAYADTSVTDSASIGMWLVDGDNTVAVEATAIAAGGYAEIIVLKSFDEPYLFEQRIDGEGRVETTVTVEGQPRWAWLDAEPVTGDSAELLTAVAALHAAIAQGDIEAYMAAHQARNDDFTFVFGPMPAEMMAQLEQMFATVTLQPLSANLVATPYADGRVWLVADDAGEPPIRMADPQEPGSTMETGVFWVRRGGVWQVVR